MPLERSFRPLPPSPAPSRPASPRARDLPHSASSASPARALPRPAPPARSHSAASATRRRPLPVPPGEPDALAPFRRLSEPALGDPRDGSGPRPLAAPHSASPSRQAVRPLPTPAHAPSLPACDATAPVAPGDAESGRQSMSDSASTSTSTSDSLLDDFECFGVRARGRAPSPPHGRDASPRRISQAALRIIARDRAQQEDAWRALVAKKNNQHGRL